MQTQIKDENWRVCSICWEYKLYKDYYKKSDTKHYYWRCKKCMNKQRMQYARYKKVEIKVRHIDTSVKIKQDICPEITLDMLPVEERQFKLRLEDFINRE